MKISRPSQPVQGNWLQHAARRGRAAPVRGARVPSTNHRGQVRRCPISFSTRKRGYSAGQDSELAPGRHRGPRCAMLAAGRAERKNDGFLVVVKIANFMSSLVRNLGWQNFYQGPHTADELQRLVCPSGLFLSLSCPLCQINGQQDHSPPDHHYPCAQTPS